MAFAAFLLSQFDPICVSYGSHLSNSTWSTIVDFFKIALSGSLKCYIGNFQLQCSPYSIYTVYTEYALQYIVEVFSSQQSALNAIHYCFANTKECICQTTASECCGKGLQSSNDANLKLTTRLCWGYCY